MNAQKIRLQFTTLSTPLPDFIYDGLKTFSTHANSYHPQPQILISKIALKHSIAEEMIYLTAGADEDVLQNGSYTIPTENIPNASLIFVANPNNPFGITAKETIIKLVENNPQAIMLPKHTPTSLL